MTYIVTLVKTVTTPVTGVTFEDHFTSAVVADSAEEAVRLANTRRNNGWHAVLAREAK